MEKKKENGVLPRFKSREEVEEIIKNYFKQCGEQVIRDEYGSIVYEKNGQPATEIKMPTVSGMAHSLGFVSREELLKYKGRYWETVARGRLKLESAAEERLYDKDGINGAKFTLLNNFPGWAEKTREEGETQVLEKLDGILEGISNAAKR